MGRNLFSRGRIFLTIVFVGFCGMLVASCIPNAIHNPSVVDYPWYGTYQKRQAAIAGDFYQRILDLSESFLGCPYEKIVDDFVMWHVPSKILHDYVRFDAVDCMSFVETVLAMALTRPTGDDADSGAGRFLSHLYNIMFSDPAKKSMATRHRFIDSEWIPYNRDLVYPITDRLGVNLRYASVFQTKRMLIENQIKNKKELDIYNKEKIMDSVQECQPVQSKIAYMPVENVLRHEHLLMRALPSISIILIISHKPQLAKEIGSHYNVTHMGFGIKKHGHVVFRHATSVGPKKVVDVPLVDYATAQMAKRRPVAGQKHATMEGILGFAFLEILNPVNNRQN